MQVQVGKHWPGCRGERLQQRFQKQKQSTWVSLSPLSQNLIKKKPQWDDYISSQIICWLDQSLLTPQRLNIWRVTRQRERERERKRGACFFKNYEERANHHHAVGHVTAVWPLCHCYTCRDYTQRRVPAAASRPAPRGGPWTPRTKVLRWSRCCRR